MSLLASFSPTWIVHCAALTNVDWCEDHPQETQHVNVSMSRNLAGAAQHVGAHLVYVSTDSVFDGTSGNYSETQTPSPRNAYGQSKLAGEHAVQEAGSDHLIVRTNIYGWNLQDKQSLAEWILHRLEAEEPVPGFFDVHFTPILVNDLSEIVLDMMEHKMQGVYHVVGAQTCSKYEFALQIAEMFGLDKSLISPVSLMESVLRAPRPKNTSLRTEKIRQELSRAMPDISSGLRRFKRLRDSGFVRTLKTHQRG